MHENNFYDPDNKDEIMIPLVNALRKGTEIEQCKAIQYNTLVARIIARIEQLSQKLCEKGLLEMGNDGYTRKTQLFDTLFASFLKRHINDGQVSIAQVVVIEDQSLKLTLPTSVK